MATGISANRLELLQIETDPRPNCECSRLLIRGLAHHTEKAHRSHQPHGAVLSCVPNPNNRRCSTQSIGKGTEVISFVALRVIG